MPKIAQLQMVRAGLLRALLDLIDVTAAGNHTGVLGACELGLYTAWAGFPPSTTIADVTEATYTGYARQAVVWGVPYVGSDTKPSIMCDSLVFRPTDAVTPNLILGAFLVDDAGDLIAIGQFDDSILLTSADEQAAILAEVSLSYLDSYGEFVAGD